ncbi:putative NCLDV-specific basal transcription factor A2L [Paratrimastix pyriformis]|uniref:NCLDV-specific basal transcription factor A2L n=2 Tax=Paratrimastix pyriformis TaxID=342808 RepID=A0ABQ8UG01_9EUKA|nr:putative NCLDV-specific basal transcription factor A2L [Paratrimastix pyriformis]
MMQNKPTPEKIVPLKHLFHKPKDPNNLCECGTEKIVSDGYNVCPSCGLAEPIEFESSVSSCDGTMYKSRVMYKRMHHLDEILNSYQGKTERDVPDDVIQEIQKEIEVRKMASSDITYKVMRKILKQLNLTVYNENIFYILSRVSSRKLPEFTADQIQEIRQMFNKIQSRYNQCKKQTRKNFLNYNFLIHNILKHLKLDEFLLYFPQMKSKEKNREQQELFNKLMEKSI